MKGKILDFSIQTNSGLISGDDDKRYKFDIQEWKETASPQRNDQVDFEIDGNGKTIDIYLVSVQRKNTFSEQINVFSEPLKSDEEQYNIIDWSKKCFINYANFNGRARRKEYWFFTLATIVISILLSLIGGDILSGIWSLVIFIPSISVGARRLHDIGRSGWWQLLPLTIVGVIVLIIFFATDTKQEDNQWGKPAR